MLKFLVENWRLFVEVIIFLITLIVCLIRKRPVSDIKSAIYSFCELAIKEAEKTDYKGCQKLQFAVDLVNSLLRSKWPSLDVKPYFTSIVSTIEGILSTPQKKEV